MSDFQVCLQAVTPIFLIIALGFLARSLGAIRRDDVPRLNKLMFRYFMPIMLFGSIYSSDISSAVRPRTLIFAVVSVLCVFFLSLVYVLLTEKEPAKRGVKIQGIYRSNFVIIGIPLAQQLVEGADIGPVVLLIAVVVPLFNVLAVICLEVFNGKKPSIKKLLLDILKNPLILSSAAGILFLLLGIRLPRPVESTISQIGAAANPMLLFLLGAFFEFDGLRKYAKDLIEICLGRLVIVPGICLTAAMLLGFRGVEFAGMIAIFGSATAISSFTMAQQMGGDAELAGDIVVATSALCSFTMFGWSLLFKALGMF
ncbi:MAG: AEC family transporter [Oscillospiraceae bacterium]|nr:AEC family transporter [Oscillospiraceae bacterium]